MSSSTSVRPIFLRPGARYTCFGDGLCCTDIHVLGPLSSAERKLVRAADPKGVYADPGLEDAKVLRIAGDGGCHFLLPDQRCSIHAEHGPMQKPNFCRRFPLGLVATPRGGRITTEHRCPCRTMGDRPLLDEASVLPALLDARGKLKADRRVKKIALTKKTKVGFEEWRTLEADLLGRLAEGEAPALVLGCDPFPELRTTTWLEESERIFIEGVTDTSGFSFAAQWFVLAMRACLEPDGVLERTPARPWAAAFDRAEQRPGSNRARREVFSDWIADVIWSLTWTDDRTFDVARAELATRLAVAERIAATLEADHAVGSGRAAAEAITVVELMGESELWTEVVSLIRS